VKPAFQVKGVAVRRYVVLGLAMLVIGAAAISHATAVPIPGTFSSSQVLTAKHLTDNFEAVEARLAALEQKPAVPTGTIVAFAGDTSNPSNIPAGWLPCDGHSYTRAQYPGLAALLGVSWGGDGTNFNVPDLQGRFVRGADNGSGHDPDASTRTGGLAPTKVGSVQTDALQKHTHDIGWGPQAAANTGPFSAPFWTNPGSQPQLFSGFPSGRTSSETRPANVAVNYIIKY
jgi:microcystin-dependent protein